MGRFAMVERGVWDDEKFEALSTDARVLFLWTWTNDRAGVSGLYACGLGPMMLAVDQECPRSRILEALGQLEAGDLVRWDETREVVWVVNRARYANRSPKTQSAMKREFETCPRSPLKAEFQERYGRILKLPKGAK